MRKVLLLIMCVAASFAVQAQPTLTNSWTKSQIGILPVAGAKNSTPVALSAQGDMYVTGLFNETFSFAGTDLEPIATSAYLLKYAADGTEKWGIELSGAATITAITTDETGNVYVAGNLADQVIFGTTSGATITKEGLKNPDDGSFYTQQGAGFVAKYDANGVLAKVQTFLPAGHPELLETFAYFPSDGDLRFNINHLGYTNGKLYASAVYTGLTQNNGFSFKGSYYDLEGGGFYYGDLAAGGIFSMNDQLDVNGIVASMRMTNANNTALTIVQSASFTLSDGKLYSGFVASGSETLTIGTQEQKFELVLPGDGTTEYGYILSAIDLSTGAASLTKKYSTTHNIGNYCTLTSMLVKDNALLLGGTFNVALPFDNSKTPTSTDDIYVVSLTKSTFDVNWTAVSGVDEGKVNDMEESFTGMTVSGNYIYAIGRTAKIAGHVAEKPLAFWINLSDGSLSNAAAADFITGVAANDVKLASAQYKIENEKLTNLFVMDNVKDNATSLPSISQDANVTVYPNPVVDVLNFSVPADVVIINLMGVTVKQDKNVSSLNVSDLTSGQYIVKVSTDEGTSTVKVIKK